MAKYTINRVELNWIIAALNHNIADIKAEIEEAEDTSPIYAIGEVALCGRENLVTKLGDIMNSGVKTVSIN